MPTSRCGSPVWSVKEELLSALWPPPAPFPRQLESRWLLYWFYIAQTNGPMARIILFMQLLHLLAHLLILGRRGVFVPGKKKISDQSPDRKPLKEARVSGARVHHGWKVQCQEGRVASGTASAVQRKKMSAGLTLLSSSYSVWDSSLGDDSTTFMVDLTPFGNSLWKPSSRHIQSCVSLGWLQI